MSRNRSTKVSNPINSPSNPPIAPHMTYSDFSLYSAAPAVFRTQRKSIATQVIMWTFIVIGVLVCIPAVGFSFIPVPSTFLLSMLFAVVLFAAIFCILRFSRLWPKGKGRGWLFAALLWGGAFSTVVPLFIAQPIIDLCAKTRLFALAASFGGAYPEEILKGMGVLFILWLFRYLDRPWHGFVVGALVGLGFEVVENILYGAQGALFDPNSDIAGVTQSWFTRTIFGFGLHPIFTGCTGYGLGHALLRAGWSKKKRILIATSWFMLGFGLHFAWNIALDSEVMMIVVHIVLLVLAYAIFLYCYIRSHLAAKNAPGVIHTAVPLRAADQLLSAPPTPHGVPMVSVYNHQPEQV
ncbi:PrsW family intramembrane metalloprotease [Corynebacterium sp. sy039]|nr:PrsW family intramembrane metalloprotease [Corynebacterium sp. sy039]